MTDFFGAHELRPENFSTDIVTCGNINKLNGNYNGGIVLFYASWCPHCVNFKDEYMKIIQNTFPGVFCKAYNSETKGAFWKSKKDSLVEGYPTIIKYRKKGAGYEAGQKYMGPRNVHDILNFISDLALSQPRAASAPRASRGRARSVKNARSRSRSRVRARSKSKARSRVRSRARSIRKRK
jgi:thiol-disulfide isomerase/thioredoxin